MNQHEPVTMAVLDRLAESPPVSLGLGRLKPLSDEKPLRVQVKCS